MFTATDIERNIKAKPFMAKYTEAERTNPYFLMGILEGEAAAYATTLDAIANGKMTAREMRAAAKTAIKELEA